MRDTEKIMKQFWEYVNEHDIEITDDNINDVMQEFIPIYNSNLKNKKEGLMELTDEEKAYDLYDEAIECEDYTKAKRLLKKSLKLKPDFLEAKMELALYKQDDIKVMKELHRLEKEEKDKLQKEGFFEDKYISCFYGILETRPYIRLLHMIASRYHMRGCYKKAIEVYENIIILNENDNLGCRHSLMGLYALFEDKEKMDMILEKYPEKSVAPYLFQAVLYYKLGDYVTARKNLRNLYHLVPDLKKMFSGDIEDEDLISDAPAGYYKPYSLEEIIMLMSEQKALFLNESIFEWMGDELLKMK